MKLSGTQEALMRRLGAGLGTEIFDLYDDLPSAMAALADRLDPAERASAAAFLDAALATRSGAEIIALWRISGAELHFPKARDARATMEMLRDTLNTTRRIVLDRKVFE